MFVARLTLVGLVAMLMAAKWDGSAQLPSLQGVWVIISVERDGTTDTTQIGGHVVFWVDTVTFQPSAKLIARSLKPLDARELARLAMS
jgi:hypothetical protein